MKRTEWNETCSLAPGNHEEVDAPVLTPLERLEGWLRSGPARGALWTTPTADIRGLELYEWGYRLRAKATAPTLDAAILAALAQAEERKEGVKG